MARYVKQHRIPWPVVVDSDRALERAAGVNEISLQNIWQARVVTATGDIKIASASDLDKAAQAALNGAKWNVDPRSMTSDLMPAWMRVEFGSYAPAATLINRSLNSRKSETKAAAMLLNDYILSVLEEDLGRAAAAESSGNLWQAYRTLSDATVRYKGFEIPRNVTADIARLETEQAVQDEANAQKKLASAKKIAAASAAAARSRAKKMLERLIEEFPGTEAAAEARTLLSGTND